ncbi:hypothetical protein PPACK8108_LOCUS2739 [Phakopsora pachyrhizi]|uniref:Uncharacterized protein n=1 Tax=Phakopsora pachyrhizi TaxID=170000 RepID=A0AAV0AK57_PHAPC|nr:hypothetical protein PPACK8108_LOCUS2739 [Phakopsora pachyrhizi]
MCPVFLNQAQVQLQKNHIPKLKEWRKAELAPRRLEASGFTLATRSQGLDPRRLEARLPRRLEASPKSKIKKSAPLKKKGERYEEVLELIPAPGDNVLPKKELNDTKSAIGADYHCSKRRLPPGGFTALEQDKSVPMQIEYHPLW